MVHLTREGSDQKKRIGTSPNIIGSSKVEVWLATVISPRPAGRFCEICSRVSRLETSRRPVPKFRKALHAVDTEPITRLEHAVLKGEARPLKIRLFSGLVDAAFKSMRNWHKSDNESTSRLFY